MDPKTFNILGIVTAVSVVLALLVGARESEVEYEFKSGRYLAGDLNLAEVGSILIDEGTTSVSLVRRLTAGSNEEGFAVDKGELTYPATTSRVNQTIKSVLEIRCAQKITESADAHAELGVAEGGPETTSVKILDRQGNLLRHILIGDQVEGASQFHVRLASEDAVYLTEKFVAVQSTEDSYLDKSITAIPAGEVSRVSVTTPAGRYVIAQEEGGEAQLLGIPEGMRAKGQDYTQVFNAGSNIRFANYEPDAEGESARTFDHTFDVETREGLVYRFSLAKESETTGEGESATTTDTFFARVRALWNGRNIQDPAEMAKFRAEIQQASAEETKAKEKLLQAFDSIPKFNARHQGWVYELGSWNAQNMIKPFEELIESADRPIEVEARHILIAYEGAERSTVTGRTKEQALERALEVLQKVLADPGRFAELAKEYSDGPSGEQGGDLGPFQYDAMAPPFSEAAFNMEVDQITPEPVETNFGFHVIQRTK